MTQTPPWIRQLSEFTTIHSSATYNQLIQKLSSDYTSSIRGTYLLSTSDGRPLSLITDGDIRRGLAKFYDSNVQLSTFARLSHCTLDVSNLHLSNAIQISNQIKAASLSANLSEVPRYVPVTGNSKYLFVIDTVKLGTHLNKTESLPRSIAVIGLGYVGLTLAVSLANKGYHTCGYDIDVTLVESLNRGVPHISEPNLHDMLRLAQNCGTLKFLPMEMISDHEAYIICVGTSIVNNVLDSEPLNSAVRSVLSVAPEYSHLYLRSTVPIGFCSELSKVYNITSADYSPYIFLSFVPERTIEGNAIAELNSLPQVIGSISEESLRNAKRLWSTLSASIVECESIEEAELIKLISNSYRDLVFGFANQVALVCESYNINAHSLIERANDNYPRNTIPSPSPGVGGYCLTKDPLLYESCINDSKFILSRNARAINCYAAEAPIRAFENWMRSNYNFDEPLLILVVGLSFKGHPATTDIRSSPSLVLLDYFFSNSINCDILDFSHLALGRLNNDSAFHLLDKVPSASALANYDGIFVMNNHLSNTSLKLSDFTCSARPKIFFDGWHQFPYIYRSAANIFYSTMGKLG